MANVRLWKCHNSLTAEEYLSGPPVMNNIGTNHPATVNPRLAPKAKTCFHSNLKTQNNQSGNRNINTSCRIPPVIPRITAERYSDRDSFCNNRQHKIAIHVLKKAATAY